MYNYYIIYNFHT